MYRLIDIPVPWYRSPDICSRGTTREWTGPKNNAGWIWWRWTSKEVGITDCQRIRRGVSCAGFQDRRASTTWKTLSNPWRYREYRSCTSTVILSLWTPPSFFGRSNLEKRAVLYFTLVFPEGFTSNCAHGSAKVDSGHVSSLYMGDQNGLGGDR